MKTRIHDPVVGTLAGAAASHSVEDSKALAAANQVNLRRCLGQFATGVTVVTTQADGHRAGMTANSFSSVSLDPPLILWSVRRASARASLFVEAEHFGVSVLSAAQEDVARKFASSAASAFEEVACCDGIGGVPMVAGALASLECQRETVIEAGDHFIIVGRVIKHGMSEGTPLLFSQGQFASPCLRKDEFEALTERDKGAAASSRSTLRLLRKAYSNLSHGFEEQRQALGLEPLSSRVLAVLDEGTMGMDQLARAACSDGATVGDVVENLLALGLIEVRAASQYALSKRGLQTRLEMAAKICEYAERRFANFSSEELKELERLLGKVEQ